MKHFAVFLIACFPLFFSAGCVSVEDTVYLQKAEVNGPVYQPPLIITGNKADSTITIAAKLYVNTTRQVHARMTNTNDITPGDFFMDDSLRSEDWSWDASGTGDHNMRWNLPDFYAGVDIDLPLNRNISFLVGATYSTKGNKELWGGSMGFSLFSMNDGLGFRLGVGTSLQQYRYDAYSLLVRRTGSLNNRKIEETRYRFHDIDINNSLCFYANMTLNWEYETSPLNFLLSLAYFRQDLLDFEPSEPCSTHAPVDGYLFSDHIYTDARGQALNSFLSITPGFYFKVSRFQRLVLGAGFLRPVEGLSNSTKSWYIIPMVKMDLLL